MKKVVKQAELRVKAFMARPVGSPTSSSTIPSHPSEAKKRKGANTVENSSFNVGAREELNVIIARMYYFGGLPFNTTAFTYATNNPISRYVPSRYNLLRTSLLQNEKANIERMLEVGTHQEHLEVRLSLFVVMDGRIHKGG